MKLVRPVLLAALSTLPALAQQSPSPKEIFEKAKAASVIVLAGEGAGRLHSIATGVVISKDGVLLTALHAITGEAFLMASPTRLDLTRPQTFASDEERLAVLRQAIEDGFAGRVVEGDIFEMVSEKYGFSLDEE